MCRMWFFSFLHLDVHVNMINWEVISYLFLPNKLSKTWLLKNTTRCFSGLRGSAGLLPNMIWDYSWGFQQLALQLGLEGLRWSIMPLRDFEWTLLAGLSSLQALVTWPPAWALFHRSGSIPRWQSWGLWGLLRPRLWNSFILGLTQLSKENSEEGLVGMGWLNTFYLWIREAVRLFFFVCAGYSSLPRCPSLLHIDLLVRISIF